MQFCSSADNSILPQCETDDLVSHRAKIKLAFKNITIQFLNNIIMGRKKVKKFVNVYILGNDLMMGLTLSFCVSF